MIRLGLNQALWANSPRRCGHRAAKWRWPMNPEGARQSPLDRQRHRRTRRAVRAVRRLGERLAIFMLDPSGHVSWNIGAERMKGYRSGILGRHSACSTRRAIATPASRHASLRSWPPRDGSGPSLECGWFVG